MRLVTYRAAIEAEARLGVLVDTLVIDIARVGARANVPLPSRMLDFIDLGPVALAELTTLLEEAKGRWPVDGALPLANVRLLAPIPRPRKNVFGIGLNYIDHVAENAAALDTSPDLPKQPVIFSKPPTSVIAPDEPIVHRADITRQLDWEVELGAIIGMTARRVTREQALAHVFGYTTLIDMSARDARRRNGYGRAISSKPRSPG